MKANIPPQLQEHLANMSEEAINEILNTGTSAVDVRQRLKEIERQLTKPNQVTIEGWAARSNDCPRDLGLRVYSVKPKRYGKRNGWNGHGRLSYLIDHRLFQKVTWKSEPLKVKITITPIEE